ncbi:MAG: hypothetical protein ACTS44_01170 [Candidatus Hodgkinia cicadicola]
MVKSPNHPPNVISPSELRLNTYFGYGLAKHVSLTNVHSVKLNRLMYCKLTSAHRL